VNIFVISEITDEYIAKRNLFIDSLMSLVERSESIDTANKKTSYLTIVVVADQDIVIIKPSEKVEKLLTVEKSKEMSKHTEAIVKEKNYVKAIHFLFELIAVHWDKYNIHFIFSSPSLFLLLLPSQQSHQR